MRPKRKSEVPVGPLPVDLPEPLEVVTETLPANPGRDAIESELQRILELFDVTKTQTLIPPASTTETGLTQELTIPALTDGTISIPVEAAVKWSVHDGAGFELNENEDFASPSLTTTPTSFVLRPEAVELTAALAGIDIEDHPFDSRTIRATVTLTAKASQVSGLGLQDVTKDIALDLPVRALKLPVPSILALFRHTEFQATDPNKSGGRRDGAVLLLVPTGSPFAQGPLQAVDDPLVSTLTQLTTTLSTLTSGIPGLTDHVTFLERLNRLVPALNGHLARPSAAAVVALRDREDNLNQIDVIDRQGLLRNDIEANNEMSSLIFVARPERVAHCYNKRRRDPARGHLKLKTGSQLSVLIENLHVEADAGQSLPGADPGEGAVVQRSPLNTFGNAISSFEFGDETTRSRSRDRLRGSVSPRP